MADVRTVLQRCLVGLLVAAHVCAAPAVPSRDRENQKSVRGKVFDPDPASCADRFGGARNVFCGATTPEPFVAVIGDSHAGHLYYGFANTAHPLFRRVAMMGFCAPAFGAEKDAAWDCDAQLRAALDFIARHPTIEIVVLSAYYRRVDLSDPARRQALLEGYLRTFAEIRRHGRKIIFAMDVPALSFDPEACVKRPLRLSQPDVDPRCFSDPGTDRSAYVALVRELQGKAPDVHFYDPAGLFCAKGACTAFIDGYLQYTNADHLSIYGSRTVVEALIRSQPFTR